jgi:4-amino-4-deoxy-L-arabinose transferase-like glycosyltransferase
MEKSTSNHKIYRRFSTSTCILLILTLLAALFMRTNGLSELDLGFDETMHTYAALGILEKGEPIMPSGLQYRRAIPFTYLVVLSFKLFGVSELSARIPSIIFGLFSVLLVFCIGQYFFGSLAGLIAALLVASLPFEIVQSRSCRMYSMYQFFFLLSFYTFYKGIEEVSRKIEPMIEIRSRQSYVSKFGINLPFLVLSFILLYFTYRIHSLIVLFYFSVLIYLAFMFITSLVTREYSRESRRRLLLFLIIWLSCGLVTLAIPNTVELAKRQIQFMPIWASYLKTYPGYYYGLLRSESLFPVLVFFALGSVQICTRFHQRGYYVLACTIVPLFVHSFVTNVQRPRYIYDIFPLIILIGSYAISNFVGGELSELRLRLRKKERKGLFRALYYFLVVSFFIAAIVLPFYKGIRDGLGINNFQAYRFGGQYNAKWRKACQYVGRYYEQGDVMIASIPLAAEFAGCKKIEYNLDNGEIDQFIKVDGERWQRHIFADAKCIVDFKDLQEVISGHRRGWLILDAQRFGSRSHVRDEVREFIRKNMERDILDGDDSIYIYRWDKSSDE